MSVNCLLQMNPSIPENRMWVMVIKIANSMRVMVIKIANSMWVMVINIANRM